MSARAGLSACRCFFCPNQFCWLLGLWPSGVDPNEIYPSGIILHNHFPFWNVSLSFFMSVVFPPEIAKTARIWKSARRPFFPPNPDSAEHSVSGWNYGPLEVLGVTIDIGAPHPKLSQLFPHGFPHKSHLNIFEVMKRHPPRASRSKRPSFLWAQAGGWSPYLP